MLILILICAALPLRAVTLEECQSLARKRSPLIKHFSTNKVIADLESDNILTNYYPQISLEGQATNQSDVFSLPIKIPGVNIDSPDKTQYQASLSINQTIWDGGITKNNLDLKKIMLELNDANIEVKLYKLNEIINSLYFNVLIIDKNIRLLEKSKESLKANLMQINSLVENGVLLPSNRKIIEIEILRIESKIQSMRKDKIAAVESLEYWVGQNLPLDGFVSPSTNETTNLTIERPELKIFDANIAINRESEDFAESSIMPKIGLFGKFGYGNPNPYNFMETGWNTYYIAGVKLSWTVFDWFNSSRNIEIAKVKSQAVEFDKEDFVRSINIAAIKDKNEIEKMKQNINFEREILNGQKAICDEKFLQLMNGTATATEYIVEQNKQSQSEINIALFELNLEYYKINLLNKYGK